jgi:hypothetical protein
MTIAKVSASNRWSLFVVAQALEDLFWLDKSACEFLLAAEPVLRSQPAQAEAPG